MKMGHKYKEHISMAGPSDLSLNSSAVGARNMSCVWLCALWPGAEEVPQGGQ